MQKLTNSINQFFKKDFKKRFLICASIPFLLSLIYVIDGSLLPEKTVTDQIIKRKKISMSQSQEFIGRERRSVGYQYFTEKKYTFSALKESKVRHNEIQMTISPLFNTVKTVKSGSKTIQVQSGLYGMNGVLIMAILISILFCTFYILIKKVISENARLNIIFFNILLFIIWGYLFFKFVM